ncbi:MAG TPA: hypothetical protein VGB87_16055 [Vicinamibacteria bacterium]
MFVHVLIGLAVGLAGAAATSAETISDPAKVDVCQRVPGADVAAALGKILKKTRPMTTDSSARCVYLLAPPGTPDPPVSGVVLWLYKAEDYDALARYTEGKIEPVPGLGDAAMRFRDPGDGLFKLRVVKRGQFAIEAVAADPDSTRKLAELALARLSK